MINQNYNPNEIAGIILAEMTAIRTALQAMKEEAPIAAEWLPRHKVMEFFGYGDTQMGTLEKESELVVTKIGNRKFYHRASLLRLLQANIQGSAQPTSTSSLKTAKHQPMRKHESCLHCDRTSTGRSDKKFCNRKCKSNFHNQKNRDPELPKNKDKKALDKNYKILIRFLGYGRRMHSRLPYDLLIAEGYSTKVYSLTTLHPASRWRIRWVYDLGLLFNEDTNYYELHQKDKVGGIIW